MASSSREVLTHLEQSLRKDFDSNRRILAFDEYVNLVAEKPERHLRGSARYAADMMDHFGKTPVSGTSSGPQDPSTAGVFRFHVFDRSAQTNAGPAGTHRKVVGQEAVQTQIYRSFRTFARLGINNKLLLLHGPNGSAKTSLIHALMAGLEEYSLTPEGAVYTFNWVFPTERLVRGPLGLSAGAPVATPVGKEAAGASYARLPDEEVMARVSCDLHDHPILLIPADRRKGFLTELLGEKRAHEIWATLPDYLAKGELCTRCKQVFESLLTANQGDLRKVLQHVQVDRFFFSARYRRGLVTIEPQLHVDAQYQQLTMSRSLGNLPASLQSLNLFSLSGDIVDGNRGMIEFSDLLKRPVDSFKYLLIACETGSVNVGHAIAHLDTLWVGSTNEIQLDAFKEFPDFMSFKARIELIRVPYLLDASLEQEIYEPEVRTMAGDKHVAPHTAWSLGLWAVLTRLKKPNGINYPPELSQIIVNLSPIEKARLLDSGEMPVSLTPDERKLLKASISRLREEYQNIPYYEGRMGASAREMKSILHAAVENPEFTCLSPLAVVREMEEFVKRISEYEFLRQDVKDGYHDASDFVRVVREEYLSKIDREVRESIGLVDSQQWEDFLRKYVQHVALVLKKEKVKNPITGKMEDPDLSLIQEFEGIVQAPSGTPEKDAFRQNIIATVGAWALDHPNEAVVYRRVFPEFWQKLEKQYYESQKQVLMKMHQALIQYASESFAPSSTGASSGATPAAPSSTDEGLELAQKTVQKMSQKLGYCPACAKEVITFLMKSRY